MVGVGCSHRIMQRAMPTADRRHLDGPGNTLLDQHSASRCWARRLPHASNERRSCSTPAWSVMTSNSCDDREIRMHVPHGRARISRSQSHEPLNDSRVPHVFEVRIGVCGWVDVNFENGTRAEVVALQVAVAKTTKWRMLCLRSIDPFGGAISRSADQVVAVRKGA